VACLGEVGDDLDLRFRYRVTAIDNAELGFTPGNEGQSAADIFLHDKVWFNTGPEAQVFQSGLGVFSGRNGFHVTHGQFFTAKGSG